MYKYIIFFLILVIVLFFVLRDKKPVMASAEIVANAPIQRVWEIQTDLDSWSSWNPDIESMQVSGELGVGTVFVWKAGGLTIESTVTEFKPNTRIAWKGKTLGTNAYHVWKFADDGNSTHIYTEEKFTGLLPWLMPGTMRNEIDKALKHGVKVLKQAAEQPSTEKKK